MIKLGEVLLAQDKYSAALVPLNQSLSVSKKLNLKDWLYFEVLECLWKASNNSNDFRNAEKYMYKYLEDCPPSGLVIGYDRLSQTYRREKKVAQALSVLQEGMDRNRRADATDIYSQSFFEYELGEIMLMEHQWKAFKIGP